MRWAGTTNEQDDLEILDARRSACPLGLAGRTTYSPLRIRGVRGVTKKVEPSWPALHIVRR